ncbi:MAG TPA: TRAP transporter permease DctM/Q, partial [Actinobacteria bacterium]|nr:TRAP transporter permease DctM/Q [Actinomycetota bacterium]
MNIEKRNKLAGYLNIIVTFLVIMLAAIPVMEILVRIIFNTGITASYSITRHVVLWIAFLGSYLATSGGRHLCIEAGKKYIPAEFQPAVYSFSKIVTVSILTAYVFSSLSFIIIVFDSVEKIGIISTRFLTSIIPVCFAAMLANEMSDVFRSGKLKSRKLQWIILGISLFAGIFLSITSIANFIFIQFSNPPYFIDEMLDKSIQLLSYIKIPVLLLIILSGVLGTPIFIILGGVTYVLLFISGGFTEIAVNEVYAVLTGNMIPAIPLFTITGFILSESRAGERLINFFKNAFGWFPGGIIIAVIMISAFFTTFTGASGVTILAIGGILYVILEKQGIDKKFRTGILTSSGSIGLLFPPSLPIILYGIISNIDIKSLFIAGILPGFLLVLSLSVAGIIYTKKHKIKSEKIQFVEFLKSIKNTFWELLLPLIILVSYFSGLTTIVETGAVAVLYILLVETFIYKELNLKGLVEVIKKSVPVIGGIL